jgi:hypothetical protein
MDFKAPLPKWFDPLKELPGISKELGEAMKTFGSASSTTGT